MCKLISEWSPSKSAMDLVKLNGVNEQQIASSVDYLKSQAGLNDIADIDGYDNWNAFFIMFCIKANKNISG